MLLLAWVEFLCLTLSPWFGWVQPGPTYWRSWTSCGPFVAGPYYH